MLLHSFSTPNQGGKLAFMIAHLEIKNKKGRCKLSVKAVLGEKRGRTVNLPLPPAGRIWYNVTNRRLGAGPNLAGVGFGPRLLILRH